VPTETEINSPFESEIYRRITLELLICSKKRSVSIRIPRMRIMRLLRSHERGRCFGVHEATRIRSAHAIRRFRIRRGFCRRIPLYLYIGAPIQWKGENARDALWLPETAEKSLNVAGSANNFNRFEIEGQSRSLRKGNRILCVSSISAFEFRPIGKPSPPRLTDSGCKFVALIRRFTVRSGSPTVTATAASVRSSGARGEADEKMGKLVLSSRAAKAASSLHGRRRLRAPDDSRARETFAVQSRRRTNFISLFLRPVLNPPLRLLLATYSTWT